MRRSKAGQRPDLNQESGATRPFLLQRRSTSIAVVAAAALLLTGCTSSADPAPRVTSTEPADSAPASSSAQAQPFTVTESAYTTTPSTGEGRFVNWAALLRNPNTTYYGAFPVITVTARDAGGQVIATQQQCQGPGLMETSNQRLREDDGLHGCTQEVPRGAA